MKKSLLSCAVLLLSASQLDAALLYEQVPDPNPPGGGAVQGSASLTDDFGEFFRVYDNFSFPVAGTVNRIDWFGQYAEVGSGANANDFSNVLRATNGFDILIWDSVGGAPSTLLSSQTIAFASVNETFIATSGDASAGTGVEFNSYSANLTSPFSVAANTELWLSIVGNLPGDINGWDWHDGVQGLPTAFQDLDVSGDGVISLGEGRITVPDVAFALHGAVIPEPASIVVWILGAAGGLVCVRRRQVSARKRL